MLVEFTVGNYRSIAEKATLSLIAAPIKSGPHAGRLDEENLIYINEKLSLLKSAVIYGANASGKSNVLNALIDMGTFMQYSVGKQIEIAYPFKPFLLMDGYKEDVSHFEIIFLLEGIQYRYGFELLSDRVEKEWLYFFPQSRQSTLFERTHGQSIKIGNYLKGAGKLKELVSDKTLFLTVCRNFKVERAIYIFDWVESFQALSGIKDSTAQHTIRCLDSNFNSKEIIDFVIALDLGISGISVTRTKNEINTQEEDPNSIGKNFIVETVHTLFNQQREASSEVKLNMKVHESQGTKKLFAMSGKIVEVLKKGRILAVDEMDSGLHPVLTKKIVELFHSKTTNPKNAQLIFSTHDTNLLSSQLFRRDQIWFTEKDRVGSTNLYSLAEVKVRNDASFETDYLHGKYGAIPFPKSFDIFEEFEGKNDVKY